MKVFSYLYPVRWFLALVGIAGILLFYSDYTGMRLFTFSNQQQWSAAGPGGHK